MTTNPPPAQLAAVVAEAERLTATAALVAPRPCPVRRPHDPHLWRPFGAHPLTLDRRCPGRPAPTADEP